MSTGAVPSMGATCVPALIAGPGLFAPGGRTAQIVADVLLMPVGVTVVVALIGLSFLRARDR